MSKNQKITIPVKQYTYKCILDKTIQEKIKLEIDNMELEDAVETKERDRKRLEEQLQKERKNKTVKDAVVLAIMLVSVAYVTLVVIYDVLINSSV